VTTRQAPRPRTRRGFVLPLVLLVILTGSLAIAATMERHSAQIRAVERRIDDYRSHHDQLGVRAVVNQWLRRASPDQLGELAEGDGPSYTFVIRNELQIRIFLEDGQGLPLGNAGAAPAGQLRQDYMELLDRLREQEQIAGLTRRVGPYTISAQAAPEPVLAALVPEDGQEFAESAAQARDRGRLDRAMLLELLDRSDVQPQDAQEVANLLTFSPTLWRIRVEADDGRRVRRFGMLAELQQNNELRVHEWLSEADLADTTRSTPTDDDEDG